ncbi:MAG TPA: hypothetical protein PLN53_08315, partial [Terricaulis sp.]|nr:hypothetical protein [Terricaulis sp.]
MALLLGLAMLPAGAIAMQVGLNALEARQSAYEEALGRRALQAMDSERRAFDEVREMLRVVAATPDLSSIAVNDCANWLSGVLSRYRDLSGLTVTSEDGAVICTGPIAAPAGFRARSAVR